MASSVLCFVLTLLSGATTGCASSAAGSGAGLPGLAPNMPAPESAVPSNIAEPNPGSFVGAGDVAAANLEAGSLGIAAKEYAASHPGIARFTSDELAGVYAGATTKAKYYFDTSGSIGRVDSVPGGWTGIVFSLSQQRWIKGTPDNDHANDQDVQ